MHVALALLVALLADIAFALGILLGAVLAQVVATVFNFLRVSRRSLMSAILQGITVGLVAGIAGLWTAIALGRYFGLPDPWLIWLAVIPPALGEFGHWMNRFSLRHLGRPDKSVFMPLGRLHAAAWEFFKSPTFHYYRYIINTERGESADSDKFGREAYQLTLWHLGKAICGLAVGAALSMWLLSRALHLQFFS